MADVADVDMKGGHAPALKVSVNQSIVRSGFIIINRLVESVKSTRAPVSPSQKRLRSLRRRRQRI